MKPETKKQIQDLLTVLMMWLFVAVVIYLACIRRQQIQ